VEITTAPPDAALWQAAAGGDVEAFAVLYDRHAARVARFAGRRVGVQDAEDLTAQTFLETWRGRDRVRLGPQDSLLPWLFGVCLNLARTQARGARRQRSLLGRLVHVGGASVEPDPADGVVDRDETRLQVARARRALHSLSPADQDVLVTCLLEDLTPAQAAFVLDQPASTVRSRLTRARRRLAIAYTQTSER
jgi:RNA polymerase sigma-70 factor (ECF subfamily)